MVLTLGPGAFTVGTSELVVVGIQDRIATFARLCLRLRGGHPIAGYALGAAARRPLLTVVTGRNSRRRLLIACLVAYIIANLCTAFVGNLGAMPATRLIVGTLNGAFTGRTANGEGSLVLEFATPEYGAG